MPSMGKEEFMSVTNAFQAIGLVTYAKLKVSGRKRQQRRISSNGVGRRGRGSISCPAAEQVIRVELSLCEVETVFQSSTVLRSLLAKGKGFDVKALDSR